MSTTARAHPNIALIKYWGKRPGPGNIPATPSLSITLDTLHSTTTVADASADRILLNGVAVDDPKIQDCLQTLRAEYDVPPLAVETSNNFPTAAGLASSASGFAALITAINAHCELGMSDAVRSDYARRASGSAARSVFGGVVGLEAPDWVAHELLAPDDWPLKVVIAVTDDQPKKVPSSSGMERSRDTSAFFPAWVSSTAADYARAKDLVAARDFTALSVLAENSCLKMHAVMMSSIPPMLYWRPASLACIEALGGLREDGVDVFYTIDAGPQIKAVCLPESASVVAAALSAVPGVLSTTEVGLGAGARLVQE